MTLDTDRPYPLILLQRAPYDGSLARSALDLALSYAVFSQNPRLLFTGEGVLCLACDQHAEACGRRSVRKVIDSLPLYDLEAVYVEHSSIEACGLTAQDIPEFARVLDDEQARQLREAARHVISL